MEGGSGRQQAQGFEIGGRRLLIYESDDLVDAFGKALTGSWLWDCSLLLATWLDQVISSSAAAAAPEQEDGASAARGKYVRELCSVRGKRIVELGAGTGAPGLAAAALGAKEVVLTDRPALLPTLLRNVLSNSLSDRVRVVPLEWGSPSPLPSLFPRNNFAAAGPPDASVDAGGAPPPPASDVAVDLILMSDLLYDVDSMPLLCRTLLDLSGPRTLALLSYEVRLSTDDCLRHLWDAGLSFTPVPQHQLPHPWKHRDDAGILVIWAPGCEYAAQPCLGL